MLLELIGRLKCLGAHTRPILDGLAYVAEHTAQRCLDLGRRHRTPRDLRVDPRLTHPLTVSRHLFKRSCDIAAGGENRMDDQAQRTSQARELSRHRVDEKGHVVSDNLHDRSAAGPTVGVVGRRVHAYPSRADGSITGELDVRHHGAEQVLRAP
jgi:hypothetical protein